MTAAPRSIRSLTRELTRCDRGPASLVAYSSRTEARAAAQAAPNGLRYVSLCRHGCNHWHVTDTAPKDHDESEIASMTQRFENPDAEAPVVRPAPVIDPPLSATSRKADISRALAQLAVAHGDMLRARFGAGDPDPKVHSIAVARKRAEEKRDKHDGSAADIPGTASIVTRVKLSNRIAHIRRLQMERTGRSPRSRSDGGAPPLAHALYSAIEAAVAETVTLIARQLGDGASSLSERFASKVRVAIVTTYRGIADKAFLDGLRQWRSREADRLGELEHVADRARRLT